MKSPESNFEIWRKIIFILGDKIILIAIELEVKESNIGVFSFLGEHPSKVINIIKKKKKARKELLPILNSN